MTSDLSAGHTLLHVDPKLPGAILSRPPRKVTITPRGKEVDLLQEIGLSISIPRNATLKDQQLDVAASFSGACTMPADMASVSPEYIIQTRQKVEFRKEVELTFQHVADLQTKEDRRNLVVMKASPTPSQRGHASSGTQKFEEVRGAKLEVSPGYVKMKVKKIGSAIYKVGKKLFGKSKSECSVAKMWCNYIFM